MELGKRNNQNFTNIPHNKLREKIKYKCELRGIKVLEIEESYTKERLSHNDKLKLKKKVCGNDF